MIVEIENLVKRYENILILDHLHLKVEENEILGILGPNGSGKTTMIHCMLSLLEYEEGSIKIFEKPMQSQAYDIKKEIGVVFQNIGVFNELTVYENISYFCSLYIKNKQTVKRMVKETIELMKLQEYASYYPGKLSTITLRKLNIACGIAHNPKFIILDEPLGTIDISYWNTILDGIKKRREQKTTILYATNSAQEAEKICTRIAILDKGRVIADGSKEKLMEMISLGEKIKISISHLTEEQKKELKLLPNVYGVKYEENSLFLKTKKGNQNLTKILEFLGKEGISFGEIHVMLPVLEDVFLEITGRNLKERIGG